MNSSINFSGFTDLLAQHARELRAEAEQEESAEDAQDEAQEPPYYSEKSTVYHD